MARTVNPHQYAARRLLIIDAALTCFAAEGYEGATTAAICRTAGIGSGTFFHYFPTKADVLVAVLELGIEETRAWFAGQAGRPDGVDVVRDWIMHTVDELADPRLPGFVRAVGAAMTQPAIGAALADDEAAQRDGLRPWVALGQEQGSIRTDLSSEQVTAWIMLLVDGFVGRLAAQEGFSVAGERAVLVDTVDRLLRPGRDTDSAGTGSVVLP